jgi:phosphate transport system protein
MEPQHTHISRRYDEELEDIRHLVLQMGGFVEQQIAMAISALANGNTGQAEQVKRGDDQVDGMQVSIDEECNQIIARRQPAASDLRLVLAVIKIINDLERIGDEAERIARMALRLSEQERPSDSYRDIQALGSHVRQMLHDALDAFARMDAEAAVHVVREDVQVDREYHNTIRLLMTYMMEDPRCIGRVMDVIWSVRSLERIGDHAGNIAEYIIYLVKGKDVRHVSLDQMEQEARS